MECGADLEWDPEKSKPTALGDYPRIRKEPKPEPPKKVEIKEEVPVEEEQPKKEELPPRTASAKSNASDSSARAREYVEDVVQRIFKNCLSEKNFN